MTHSPSPSRRFGQVRPNVSDAALALALVSDPDVTYEEWVDLYCLAGRGSGPALVVRGYQAGVFAPGALAPALNHAWHNCEFPADQLGTWLNVDRWAAQLMWVEMFRAAGFAVDGAAAPAPTEPVHLYRAALAENRCGMSWTTDLEFAKHFAAHRQSGRPMPVWQLTSPPGDVLAVITSRQESEHVVVPPESVTAA